MSVFRIFVSVVLAAVLAGCSADKPTEFLGTDLSGTDYGKALSMPDTTGELRTLEDFSGKVTVVFFGFTQCPDICPTALAEMAHTLELLDDQANNVQVVFITVDPERDTPEILQEYVQAFDDRFMGLTGSDKQLEKTAKSFKVYYARAPENATEDYSMDHSASFYVFDQKGEPRVLISGDAPADEIASDIRQLL
ncbi:MAG TPA: SCO family protein [Burkholderiaceae bacterium]|nr:SCO family protein [Burkholderiaceae bacterium]